MIDTGQESVRRIVKTQSGKQRKEYATLASLLDLDTNTFQQVSAQFCPVFDGFFLWAMGV
jgi:hypothetical protein